MSDQSRLSEVLQKAMLYCSQNDLTSCFQEIVDVLDIHILPLCSISDIPKESCIKKIDHMDESKQQALCLNVGDIGNLGINLEIGEVIEVPKAIEKIHHMDESVQQALCFKVGDIANSSRTIEITETNTNVTSGVEIGTQNILDLGNIEFVNITDSEAFATTILDICTLDTFSNNIDLCSTKNSIINESHIIHANEKASQKYHNNYEVSMLKNTFIDEYLPVRKKIKCETFPNRSVRITSKKIESKNLKKSCIYKPYGEFLFTPSEYLIFREHFTDRSEFIGILKYLEDILREKFKQINNACPINFCGHYPKLARQDLKIVHLYARCIYFKNGCCRYKFSVHFLQNTVKVDVFTTNKKLVHPQDIKKQQLRGIRRLVAKQEILGTKSSNWRNLKLYTQSKSLLRVGNNQEIPSRSAARKLKSEAMRALDRDPDNFLDLYKMYKDKEWKDYIQEAAVPQKIYLFTEKQLAIMQANRKKLLKLSRNTLFFDATGSILRKFDKSSKRVFLYSLIAHIRSEEKKEGILLPVAEAFLSSHYTGDILQFLVFLKTFCQKKGIAWPIAERICTDWSLAIINSVLIAFNCEHKIVTITDYVKECYTVCIEYRKPQFTIVQICCAHFIRIVVKDLTNLKIEDDVIKFLKCQICVAINICKIKEFFVWVKNIFTVICSKQKTEEVLTALTTLDKPLKEVILEIDEEINTKDTQYDDHLTSTYTRSPFYIRSLEIYNDVKKNTQGDGVKNKYYCDDFAKIILKKYVPYAPMWSNIMGHFVDDTNTRIANSPAEGYFHINKNITLEGKQNIRATEYIRQAYIYAQAKIAEIEILFPDINPKVPKKILKLDEDEWKRTPKKIKDKFNKNIVCQKLIAKFQTLPRTLRNSRNYVLLKFQNIYDKLHLSINFAPNITIPEFKTIDGKHELYNNIVDIFISILVLKSNDTTCSSATCEAGYNFFYGSMDYSIDFMNFETFFIPILHNSHFTLVYLNFNKKTFIYLNPLGIDMSDYLFQIFLRKINQINSDWKVSQLEHDTQNDNFNCGVFICQYVEALLANKSLNNLQSPRTYRQYIKEIFITHTDDMQRICIHCGILCESVTIKCEECDRTACDGCYQNYYVNKGQALFKCEICET